MSVATHGVLAHPGPWMMADVEALSDAGDHARYGLLSPGGRLTTPDIAVVDGRVADTDPVRYPSSAVHLVVEIVSPGSRATDRAIKPELYAEAGILAYWRLELQPAPHLITYTLEGEHYAAMITLHAGHLGELAAPFPVRLDPANLVRRRAPGGH